MGKIRRLDHIAVAVKNLDDAIERFGNVLGAELIRKKEINLSGSRICVAYLKLGDTIIALDQATDPSGFVTKFIERRGEGEVSRLLCGGSRLRKSDRERD